MKRGKCSETRKVNRVKLLHFSSSKSTFSILHLLGRQSAAQAFLTIFCGLDMLQGEVQGRCDTSFASSFAIRTAFIKWKRGRCNASHLECYVLFLQLTEISCMGHLAAEKGLQLSVLLPHILIVTCLFKLMSLTIFHNSCSLFKYQKCYLVTLLCTTMM